MNSQIEEAAAAFADVVRKHAAYEAVTLELFINSQTETVTFTYRTPESLIKEGISMRNLAGEFIRASAKPCAATPGGSVRLV